MAYYGLWKKIDTNYLFKPFRFFFVIIFLVFGSHINYRPSIWQANYTFTIGEGRFSIIHLYDP